VFLAMELIDGHDLAEHMARSGRLAPDLAARIVADVCSALAEAHALGLVHRDVKPENILLGGPNGEMVKLTDFGIAKSAIGMTSEPRISDEESFDDPCPDSVNLVGGFDLTTAGTLVGSPGYMAPEQWNSRPVDARTDLYACGVMLYQLVTGRLPFEAENPFMVAAMQMKDTPLAPHVRNPKVSRTLSAIIVRAIRPSPEDRFQTAAELQGALRAAADESAVMANLALDHTLTSATFVSPVSALFSRTELLPAAETLVAAPAASKAPVPAAPVVTVSPAETAFPTKQDLLGLPIVHDDFDNELTSAMTHRPLGRDLRMSPARVGRTSPVPPEPVVSLARITTPPAMRTALATAQLRFLVPLGAAFLALGVVLGILLFFPLR
jgi:serine/threonine-protein kinase